MAETAAPLTSASFAFRSTRPVTWRRVRRWRGTHLGRHGCPSTWLRAELVRSRGCATCAGPTCPTPTSCRSDAGRWRHASVPTMAQQHAKQIVSYPVVVCGQHSLVIHLRMIHIYLRYTPYVMLVIQLFPQDRAFLTELPSFGISSHSVFSLLDKPCVWCFYLFCNLCRDSLGWCCTINKLTLKWKSHLMTLSVQV